MTKCQMCKSADHVWPHDISIAHTNTKKPDVTFQRNWDLCVDCCRGLKECILAFQYKAIEEAERGETDNV